MLLHDILLFSTALCQIVIWTNSAINRCRRYNLCGTALNHPVFCNKFWLFLDPEFNKLPPIDNAWTINYGTNVKFFSVFSLWQNRSVAIFNIHWGFIIYLVVILEGVKILYYVRYGSETICIQQMYRMLELVIGNDFRDGMFEYSNYIWSAVYTRRGAVHAE